MSSAHFLSNFTEDSLLYVGFSDSPAGDKEDFMVEKTKIVNADIYRSSAVVKRRGTLTLEAGRNTVFIAGLTVSSLTDTMRLKFVGNVKALDINYISGWIKTQLI